MILTDLVLIKKISDLTSSYDDVITYSPESKKLFTRATYDRPKKEVSVNEPQAEVESSIKRIAEKGYIEIKKSHPFFMFTLLPRMNHRFNYWLDDFTKMFWGGFAAGVASSLLASFIFKIIVG